MALALAVFWTSRAFPNVPGHRLGAATLPGIVAAGLFVCGLLLVVRGLRARRGAIERDAPAPASASAPAERIAPAVGILASIGLYLLASERIGYPLTAPVCLLIAMRALRVGWPTAIVASLVASIAVHVAFYKLLKVPLPWGVLPVLY
jgi:putative tricarboxylic transport membrane protein